MQVQFPFVGKKDKVVSMEPRGKEEVRCSGAC